jgi:hypothetical protein
MPPEVNDLYFCAHYIDGLSVSGVPTLAIIGDVYVRSGENGYTSSFVVLYQDGVCFSAPTE